MLKGRKHYRASITTTSDEWKNWCNVVTEFMRNELQLNYLLENQDHDDRLFMNTDILGTMLPGLLDSGASRSVLGERGFQKLKHLRLKIQSSGALQIKTACGQRCNVQGIIELPMKIEGEFKLFDVLYVPEVSTDLILGLDFWKIMGIVPDVAAGSWKFSREDEINYISEITRIQSKFTENDHAKVQAFLSKYCIPTEDRLGCTTLVKHKIDTGTAEPIKQRYYPVSPAKQKLINEELDSMLAQGIVEPSKSAWSSPIVLLEKPDGSKRFVVDLRKVNQVTTRDAYPLPYVSSILDRLRDSNVLSSIDLKRAYWQVPLEESSKEKTAFTVPGRGLFHFTRMPFGLHNSPATWQRLIDKILGPDLEPYVFVYLDDIIIATLTIEEHLRILEEVLKRLHAAGLSINKDKCVFGRSELKYLGYVVDNHGLRVDPSKVESILHYPRPNTAKEIRRFIGLTSWYRRFVPNFSTLIAPLTQLTRKRQKFVWSEEAEKSFRLLKEKLIEAPIMSCPDFTLPFVLQTDASAYGLGWVLSQVFEDGEHVIAYGSRTLTKQERNLSTTERECLAVIWGIEKNRHYLEGTHFTVITDHYSLLWLHNLNDPGGKLSRWSLRLQPYDFSIVHRKGSEHLVPDALSRAVPIDLITISPEITDKWYLKMKKQVEEHPLQFPQWRLQENHLYKNVNGWKLVIPKDSRTSVYKECHDDPKSGHLGIYKTYKRVSQLYYWPKMRNDVGRYVNHCTVCIQYKPDQRLPAGLMGKSRKVEHPWQLISTDILGPFPRSSKGNKYILVVADWFTKYTLLFPLRSATASKICKHIEEDVILMYGAPQQIVCDNGSQYAGKEMKALAHKYQSHIFFNAKYHPQVNPSERINRVVKTMIASYVEEKHTKWDTHLAKIGYALRTATHEVTGYTPAYLNFAREIHTSGKVYGSISTQAGEVPEIKSRAGIQQSVNTLKEVYQEVNKRLQHAYEQSAKRYNLRRRPVQFCVGQIVYKRNFAQSSAPEKFTAKLAPKYIGPFTIVKKLSPLVYELENNKKRSIGYWHVQDLKPNPD